MVYPFSPALIQALVAVSSALQRERTALKIMLQLLVNRRDTLRLGDVIPLGDLWDVVAHGDEAFTDVMRVNFENAKKLYQNKLCPMLEQQHEIDLEVDRERAQDRRDRRREAAALRERRPAREEPAAVRPGPRGRGAQEHDLHAAGGPEPRDDPVPHSGPGASGRRPEAPAPGRAWSARSGSARSRPTRRSRSSFRAWIPRAIIEAARAYDNPGNRQYQAAADALQVDGHARAGRDVHLALLLVAGQQAVVRRALHQRPHPCPTSRSRSGDDWKLIIDFPFDSEGHSPIEDLDRMNKFREKNERQRTLVWLPSFFSTRTQAELGKLVIIDRLLLGNNLDQHAQHLSLQDRQTARLLLQNQQSALSQRLIQAVEAAYAIRSEPTPGTLDAAYDMSESHFQSLYPTLVLQRPVGANLGEALEHLLDQALSHQFPKHPKFGQEIKLGKDLRQVLEVCQEAARTPDGRVFVEDKAVRQKLSNICNPLELGQMSETHFVLGNYWKNHFNRLLAASEQPHPTVADLRRWTDQPEERGLPREIQNLLILVYADQTNRSFVRYGGNYTPSLDDLPNELELQEQTLPDLKDWEEAVTRVGRHPGPRHLQAAQRLEPGDAGVRRWARASRSSGPTATACPTGSNWCSEEPGRRRGGGRQVGPGEDGQGGQGAARARATARSRPSWSGRSPRRSWRRTPRRWAGA